MSDYSYQAECEMWDAIADQKQAEAAKHCGAWSPERHLDRGAIDCGCGWGAYCDFSSERTPELDKGRQA